MYVCTCASYSLPFHTAKGAIDFHTKPSKVGIRRSIKDVANRVNNMAAYGMNSAISVGEKTMALMSMNYQVKFQTEEYSLAVCTTRNLMPLSYQVSQKFFIYHSLTKLYKFIYEYL